MLIELPGVTLNVKQDCTGGFSHEAQECTHCHRMTHFFENRNGETRCTACPGPQRGGQS